MAVIPTRYPSFIILIALPISIIQPKRTKAEPIFVTPTLPTQDSSAQKQKLISFEARRAGPMMILGPAKGVFGQSLIMTHIAANQFAYINNTMPEDYYHFVTWNDESVGEYCLWRMAKVEKDSKTSKFEWFPKLIVPKVYDRAWLEVGCTTISFTYHF